MALKSKTLPWGGMTIKCKDLLVNASDNGDAGTAISADQLTAIAAVPAATMTAFADLSAANIANVDDVSGNIPMVKQVTFTETAGAGVYTGIVVVPAGAYIHDIIVHGVAVWDNAGAVDMDVGVTGTATAYFDITSLKAAGDLLAGESISFGTGSDGSEGGTLAATNFARYDVAARNVTGIITTASTGGSTGRTRMLVIYSVPNSTNTTAATKV